jgi:hypothetical protein
MCRRVYFYPASGTETPPLGDHETKLDFLLALEMKKEKAGMMLIMLNK